MTDVARKQNATNIANTHKRRNTFSSTVKIDDIRSLDLDEWTVGAENFNDKRKKIENQFIVKSFLKNCYSMLTTGAPEKKKEATTSSPSRRMTVQPTFKQFENFKLMMSGGPTAIEEENDEEVVIIKHVTPVESFRNSQEVSKIDISFPSGFNQFKTIEETKDNVSSKSSERIKQNKIARPGHHRQATNNIIYDKIVKQKDGSGLKKKKKLNQILSRLTKQTESSERRNRNSQNESFTKPAHPYENNQVQTSYNPYMNRKVVSKKKNSVSKSAEKSKSPLRSVTELNNIVKLTKRVHDVNKQKGLFLAKVSKGQSKVDGNVEFIINEQSSIIEEYHKYLKEAIDKNEKLEKKIELLKKELDHKPINKSSTCTIDFQNKKKEINPKITVTDCLKNNIVTISYKTPGKHKKNAKSFVNYLETK